MPSCQQFMSAQMPRAFPLPPAMRAHPVRPTAQTRGQSPSTIGMPMPAQIIHPDGTMHDG